jgi:autotransporter adhesin
MSWRRFEHTDKRIDRSGAMQTAMSMMTASAAGIRTDNRLAVGSGSQNGHAALSVGYQRAVGDRASVTLGGAFTNGESSVGLGYGVGW